MASKTSKKASKKPRAKTHQQRQDEHFALKASLGIEVDPDGDEGDYATWLDEHGLL